MRRLLFLITGLIFLFGAVRPTVAIERTVVKDLTGAPVAPLDPGKRRATVLLFITNDCPIANSYAPEIERIYRAYLPKQIGFYLVYVDPSVSLADMREHHKEYGYTVPAVFDPQHRLVKRAQVTVTPEAAVFGPGGNLLYHGRIDDRAVAFGQMRVQPKRRDLRDTLDALLQGKSIPSSTSKAVGCTIADLARTP